MRKVLAVSLVALHLSGCAAQTQATIDTIVATARKYAVAYCGYQPTINTVANIIRAGDPLIQTAEAVANAICTAVTAPAPVGVAALSSSARPVPMVAGVVVKGKFVRR